MNRVVVFLLVVCAAAVVATAYPWGACVVRTEIANEDNRICDSCIICDRETCLAGGGVFTGDGTKCTSVKLEKRCEPWDHPTWREIANVVLLFVGSVVILLVWFAIPFLLILKHFEHLDFPEKPQGRPASSLQIGGSTCALMLLYYFNAIGTATCIAGISIVYYLASYTTSLFLLLLLLLLLTTTTTSCF